jgi:hypothetical protein
MTLGVEGNRICREDNNSQWQGRKASIKPPEKQIKQGKKGAEEEA